MIKKLLLTGFIFSYFIGFSQKYNAELLVQETRISVYDNKLIKHLYQELKINNRSGEKYGKISIPFSNLNKVNSLKAYVKDANGNVVKKLKKSEIIEKSSISNFSFYEDDFVKEFTLKHNEYPYTIVYSYQVQQEQFIYIDYWLPLIDDKIPTRQAKLVISVPKKNKIVYHNNNVNDPIITISNFNNIYTWSTSYNSIVKHEEFSPPLINYLPSVKVVPQNFNYGIDGSFESWIDFGNWQNELMEGLNVLPAAEKVKILKKIENIESDKEKIQSLYHYLQDETRYINVTIETGGLKPYPASYVVKNKYGDCKALSNYFKSILDYIQIPSYYAKVYAGKPIEKVNLDFPSQQSNHIILYIPLAKEDIWLDCTSDGAFNYLGTFTQNRNALIVKKDSSRFLKTPRLKPEDILESRKIEIDYTSNNAAISVESALKGESYEYFTQLEKNFNNLEKDRILRNISIGNDFQLDSYSLSNPNRDSLTFFLSYNGSSQGIYKHYGNNILIHNIAFSLPKIENPENRRLPLQIDYPIYKCDTLIYDIPIAYDIIINKKEYLIENEFGNYSFNIHEQEDEDDKITIIKRIQIYAGEYPLSDYEKFYNFYKQVLYIENLTHLSLNK